MAKIGRKKAKISRQAVEALAVIGMSNVEIADLLGVHEKTIRNRFSDVLLQKRAELRKSLRVAQIQAALHGNTAMMIWLGKQMLGQADKQETLVAEIKSLKPVGFDFSHSLPGVVEMPQFHEPKVADTNVITEGVG